MIKLLVQAFLVLCLGTLIQAQLKVYQCKSTSKPVAKITKLDISGADAYPVVLQRGENATINIEFTALSKITSCKLKILGELNGKQLPFQATNDDQHCLESINELKGKKNLVLHRNKNYSYSFSMDVKKEYPAVSVIVNYQLVFGTKPIICFTFPAKIS